VRIHPSTPDRVRIQQGSVANYSLRHGTADTTCVISNQLGGRGCQFWRPSLYHAVANECIANQGEKSFSTLAFVMALSAQSMGPMLALDEFDVFMDEKNRNLCFSVLCAEVSRCTGFCGKCNSLCPSTM
jgi:hypothetical protein